MTDFTHTDRETVATAYHEAGHAAVAVWFGARLERVELTPDHPLHAGCCHEKVDDPDALSLAVELGEERVIRPQIQILLAGRVAQEKSGFDDVRGGDRHDLDVARRLATVLVGCVTKADALLDRLLVETRKVLDATEVWGGVEALASDLLTKGRVEGDEAHTVLATAGPWDRAAPTVLATA